MQSISIPLRVAGLDLPIQITCYVNGYVSFERLVNFHTIVDSLGDGLQAIISNEDIAIGANTVVEYGYDYDYKRRPELLAWLKNLNMVLPKF